MVAVKEFSWEEVSSPDFSNPARQAWREVVVEIAAKAKASLPECNGRVEKAAAIVPSGPMRWRRRSWTLVPTARLRHQASQRSRKGGARVYPLRPCLRHR